MRNVKKYILGFNNWEEKLQLPVNPKGFKFTFENANETMNLNSFGEINLIGNRKLGEIEPIASFFPKQKYPFVTYTDFPPPYKCVETIKKWMDSKKPIRLVITDTIINHAMTIEKFSFEERDGTGDVYYELTLKEYRFQNMEKNTTAEDTKTVQLSGLKKRPEEKKEKSNNITYKVKKGDTLWDISKKYLGSGSRWKEIAKKNNIKDPRQLKIGMELKI